MHPIIEDAAKQKLHVGIILSFQKETVDGHREIGGVDVFLRDIGREKYKRYAFAQSGAAWKNILVVFNGDTTDKDIALPEGEWTVAVNGNKVGEKGFDTAASRIKAPATSELVLFKD